MSDVRVKLRRGHPNRVMLARLADDQVVSVDEAGLVVDAGLVSAEMRGCGWIEVDEETSTQRHKGTKEEQGQEEPAGPSPEVTLEPESGRLGEPFLPAREGTRAPREKT